MIVRMFISVVIARHDMSIAAISCWFISPMNIGNHQIREILGCAHMSSIRSKDQPASPSRFLPPFTPSSLVVPHPLVVSFCSSRLFSPDPLFLPIGAFIQRKSTLAPTDKYRGIPCLSHSLLHRYKIHGYIGHIEEIDSVRI